MPLDKPNQVWYNKNVKGKGASKTTKAQHKGVKQWQRQIGL